MQSENDLPAPVPWSMRDVWLGLIGLALLLAMGVVCVLALRLLQIRVDLGLAVALLEALMLAPAWWLTVRKYKVGWETLGFRGFSAGALGPGCALLLAAFVFNVGYALLLGMFGLRIQADLTPLATAASPWWLVLGAVAVAPVAEEVFFRGFIFAALRKRYGWRKAGAISSAMFAVAHFTPTAAFPLFVLGWLFAYLYESSRSLWPAILLHSLVNGVAIGAIYFLIRTGSAP